MKLANTLVRMSGNSLVVALTSAIAAGLGAGAFRSVIHRLNQQQVNPLAYVKFMLTAVAAYLVVALLLHYLWYGLCERLVPVWIPIAILGSAVFVLISLTPDVINAWYDEYRGRISLSKYILTEFYAARDVITFLSLITLPITGAIYYTIRIVQKAKAWHNPNDPPSILGQ